MEVCRVRPSSTRPAGRPGSRPFAATVAALLAFLVVALAPSTAHALPYPDLSGDEWYIEALQDLSDEGVIHGRADGTFGPYDPISRAEFSAMLADLLDLTPGESHPFTDFPAGSWYEPAVAALCQTGLANGVSTTAFDPEGTMSRQQAASLLMRALEYRHSVQPVEGLDLTLGAEEVDFWLQRFGDRQLIAEVHRASVANAYRLQIVSGRLDGLFYPLDQVTRSQSVGMLYATLVKIPVALAEPPPPAPSYLSYPDAALGSQGAHVLWLEQRLTELTYRPGPVDGVFDHRTNQAVIAFQKWEGLQRNGMVDRQVWTRLQAAARPHPNRTGSGIWIEVNLTKQVFLYVQNGTVTRTLPTSTGRSFTYRSTPYTVQRKPIADGPRYRALYLNPGNVLAIHGYPSVPVYPASDGCIRLPKWDMDDLRANDPHDPMIPDGTKVYIR
ncbi:MAG: S-layer homology domain-containing protein [Thermoleophilia bacterium]|nr:S-layer homology domain-containing protein [Thermoleophilia bacterium]